MRNFKEYILAESNWKRLWPKFKGNINSDEEVKEFLLSNGFDKNTKPEVLKNKIKAFRDSYNSRRESEGSPKTFAELVKSGEIDTAINKAKHLETGDYSDKVKDKASKFINVARKAKENHVVSEAENSTAQAAPADSQRTNQDTVRKLDQAAAELDKAAAEESIDLETLGNSRDPSEHADAEGKVKKLLTQLVNNDSIYPSTNNSSASTELAQLIKKDGDPNVLSSLEARMYVCGQTSNTPKPGRAMGIAVLWLNTMVPSIMNNMDLESYSGFSGIAEDSKKSQLLKLLKTLNGKKLAPELAKQIGSLPADYNIEEITSKIINFTKSLKRVSAQEVEAFKELNRKPEAGQEADSNRKNPLDKPPVQLDSPSGSRTETSAEQSKEPESPDGSTASSSGTPESDTGSSYKDYATRDPDNQLFGIGKLTFRNTLEDIKKAILHDFGSADGNTEGNILRSHKSIADYKRDENDKEYKDSKVNFESYNPVLSAISKNEILSERFAIRGRINTSKEHTKTSWNRYKTEMGNVQRKYCNTAHKIIAKWDDQLTSTPDRKKIIDNLKLLSSKYSSELNRILKNAEKKNSYSELGKIFHDVRDVAGSAKKFVGDKIKDSSAGRAAAYDAQQIKAAVSKVDISALRAAAEKNPQNFRTFAYAVRNPGYLENPDTTTGDPKSKVTIGSIAGNIVTDLGFQSDKESVKSFIKAFNQTYITKENMDSEITKLIMDKSAEYGKASTISVVIDDLQRIQKFSSSAVAKLQNLNKEGKGISSEQALLTFIRNPSADLSKLQVSEMSFSEYYNILYEWKDAAARAQSKAKKARDKAAEAEDNAAKIAAEQQKQAHRKEVVNWYKQNNKGYEKLRANLSDDELLTLTTMLLLASKSSDIKSQAAAVLQMREKDGKSPQDYLQAAANYSQEHPDIVSNIQKTLEKVFTTQSQQPQQNAPAQQNQQAQQNVQQPAAQNPQSQQSTQPDQNPQRKLGEVPASASVTTASAGSYNIPDRLFKKMIRRKLGF